MDKLILTLKKLNFLSDADDKNKFTIKSFADRLFYQKLIFLLNELTDELGRYKYNWYLRGPYSPGLAHDLYNIMDIINTDYTHINSFIEDVEFTKDLSSSINKLDELENAFKESFDGSSWEATDLEILASLVFIEKYTFSKCKGSKAETMKVLLERKPELEDKPIDEYYDLLKSEGFFG